MHAHMEQLIELSDCGVDTHKEKEKYSRVVAYLVTKQPPLGITKWLSDVRGYY